MEVVDDMTMPRPPHMNNDDCDMAVVDIAVVHDIVGCCSRWLDS